MITARPSVVDMPLGHYKLADVLRHVMEKNRKGIKKGTGSYRKPPKRTRPAWDKHQYYPRKAVRLADEWKRSMELQDPDGMTELCSSAFPLFCSSRFYAGYS
jgi:3-hydroxyacyl-CoA dehydrogenase